MIVTKERAYGNIKNINDLVQMQEAANAHGIKAIGITDNGSLYTYDPIAGIANAITPDNAKEVLKLSDAEFSELISSRGQKDLFSESHEEAEDTTLEAEEVIIDESEELQDDVSEEVIHEDPEISQEDLSTFQEEIVEETPEDRTTAEVEEIKDEKPAEEVIHECPACEDCIVYKDKISLAKESIHQKIDEIDDFKSYLQGLLEVLG